VDFYLLILGILAVWSLTNLLVAEDGPWDAVVRLRGRAGAGLWGRLLDCFHCLSWWIAAPLALILGTGWRQRLLLWPALSAGAILLERATSPERGTEHNVEGSGPPAKTSNTRREMMPCCGDKRRKLSGHKGGRGAAERASGGASYHVATDAFCFEYTGTAGIIVWGPITGRRYLFAGRATKVVVDGRDAPSLSSVPNLRRVEIG
jgi:hypothetical protein